MVTFQGLKDYLDKIHWPQAAVLCVFLTGAFSAPVAFFSLVKPEILNILIALPWTVILTSGVPAVMAALAAVLGFFGPSLVKRDVSQPVVAAPAPAPERDDTHEAA